LEIFRKILCGTISRGKQKMTKKKLFYVKYSIQIYDGIENFRGHIYAEDENHAQQIINQIAKDLNADDKFIYIVEDIEDE